MIMCEKKFLMQIIFSHIQHFFYISLNFIYIKSFSYIFHITQLLFNDIHGVFSLKTYLVLHPRLSSKYFIRKFIYYSLCLHLYYYAPHIIYTIIYWEDDKKKMLKFTHFICVIRDTNKYKLKEKKYVALSFNIEKSCFPVFTDEREREFLSLTYFE